MPIALSADDGDVVGPWVRVIQRDILLDGQDQAIISAMSWYCVLDDPENV